MPPLLPPVPVVAACPVPAADAAAAAVADVVHAAAAVVPVADVAPAAADVVHAVVGVVVPVTIVHAVARTVRPAVPRRQYPVHRRRAFAVRRYPKAAYPIQGFGIVVIPRQHIHVSCPRSQYSPLPPTPWCLSLEREPSSSSSSVFGPRTARATA